jgi:hypothetical protein
MTWTPLIIIGAGVLGVLCAMVVGFVYTVSVGGIQTGDPRENVVAGILVAGMIIGLLIGWWLV